MSKTLQPAASTSLGNGYAMLIDATRCIDCKGCLTSCKVAHQVPPGQSRNWIKVKDSPRQGRGRAAHGRRSSSPAAVCTAVQPPVWTPARPGPHTGMTKAWYRLTAHAA